MRALRLVNQLWFTEPVNPWKNRASFELLYTIASFYGLEGDKFHPAWFVSV